MIQNPILPGFNPDPSILCTGEDYYIATSTFEWFPGIAIYHSRNLKDWELHSHALTEESQLNLSRLPSAKGVWAPCLTYNKREKLYYLAYSMMYSHNARYFDVDNFVVTATSLQGPWSQPVYLHSVGFDPSFFHDDDKKSYVVCLEWEMRDGPGRPAGIVCQEYDPVLQTMIGESKEIWRGGTKRGCVEGPHLYKHAGMYYLLCAEGGTGYGHCVTIARSSSPWGPYEGDPENPILSATEDFEDAGDWFLKTERYNPKSPLQKAGHASWVENGEQENYLVHLCARPFVPELRCTLGRETAIEKAYWTEDGWLRLEGEDTLPKLEVPEPSLAKTVVSDSFLPACKKEDFDLKWNIHLVSPRWDRRHFSSLTERKGFLRLHGNQSLCSLDSVAMVARRLQSLEVFASTIVEYGCSNWRQSAGIVAYYDNMNYRFLRITKNHENEERSLMLTSLANGERTETFCTFLPPLVPVRLGLEISGRLLRFAWAEGEGNPLALNPSEDGWSFLASRLDTSELSDEYSKFGEFTGTFIGLACVDTKDRRSFADFDWFDYRHKN
jgi:xylan 1,4-beta-xylosidase